MRRQHIHKDRTQDVRDEIDDADIRDPVRYPRSELYAREDGDDLDDTVDAAEQGGLEGREAELRDDDLALVRERVRDVVERGEEGEDPGLGVH